MNLPSNIIKILTTLLNRIGPVFLGSAAGSSSFGTLGLVAGTAVGVLASSLFEVGLFTAGGIAILVTICIQILMKLGFDFESAREFARRLINLIRNSTGMNNEASYVRALPTSS